MGVQRSLNSAATGISVIVLLIVGLSCKNGNPVDSNNDSGILTDADGNVYTTMKIGNQVWMAENLRTTKYNDGTVIPVVTDSSAWSALTTPGCCYYNNTIDSGSIKKTGIFYNWYAVNTHKLAPAGWLVPTDSEWMELENYLIANRYYFGAAAGNKIAKALAAKTDWRADTTTGTIGCDPTTNNRSGFSALPGSCRGHNGAFGPRSDYTYLWSASEGDSAHAWGRDLYYNHDYLSRGNHYKRCGFSVRLVHYLIY